MKIKWRSVRLTVIMAALVSCLEARAQIIGYVNIYFTNGYSFVANPLYNYDTNFIAKNNLTNLIPSAPDGTLVYLWDVPSQAFSEPATFVNSNPGWSRSFDLPVGRGFVVYSPTIWTNTFVGAVFQASTNFIPGNNKLSLLACKVPLAGKLSAELRFPHIDGVTVHLFRGNSQSYTDAFTDFSGYGWLDPRGIEDISGPNIRVSESFFVQNPGSDTNWVFISNFLLAANASSISGSEPELQSISIENEKVSLRVRNSKGGEYDVQFSSEGLSWTTVASRQRTTKWTTSKPGTDQGYYRLVRP